MQKCTDINSLFHTFKKVSAQVSHSDQEHLKIACRSHTHTRTHKVMHTYEQEGFPAKTAQLCPMYTHYEHLSRLNMFLKTIESIINCRNF